MRTQFSPALQSFATRFGLHSLPVDRGERPAYIELLGQSIQVRVHSDRGVPLVTLASAAAPEKTFPVESVVSYLTQQYVLPATQDDAYSELEKREAQMFALFSPENIVERNKLEQWCLSLNKELIERASAKLLNSKATKDPWWKLW